MDRALSMGAQGILGGEVKSALYDAAKRPSILGFLAGYGGREVTLETAFQIVEKAKQTADWPESAVPDFIGLKPELLDLEKNKNGI